MCLWYHNLSMYCHPDSPNQIVYLFRAMLMKRKKPQKKVVVKKTEWLESPVDQECQEGKIDKITFSARLSEKEKRGKWYIGNNVSNCLD